MFSNLQELTGMELVNHCLAKALLGDNLPPPFGSDPAARDAIVMVQALSDDLRACRQELERRETQDFLLHDLGNLLAVIQMESSRTELSHAPLIGAAAERATHLLQILGTPTPMHTQLVPLGALLESIQPTLELVIRGEVLIAGQSKILVPETLIERVLLNLAINSREATASELRIDVKHDRGLLIQVVDNGNGFPLGLLHRVGDAGFTTKPDGKGLGIEGCRRLLAEVGGSLTVGNDSKGGASVVISLPE